MTVASGTGGGDPHRSRAPVVERSDLDAADRAFYDRIVATRPAVEGPFSVLIHSPDLAARVADVGSDVRFESSIPFEHRCLAALMEASHFGCRFMWAGWAPQAERAGLGPTLIEAIRTGSEPEDVPVDRRLAWAFGNGLLT